MRLALPSVMTAIPSATLVVRTSAFIEVLLSCTVSFPNLTSKRTLKLPLRATEFRFCCPDLPQPGAHHGFRTQPENWPSCHMTNARHRRGHPPGLYPPGKSPPLEPASPFPS